MLRVLLVGQFAVSSALGRTLRYQRSAPQTAYWSSCWGVPPAHTMAGLDAQPVRARTGLPVRGAMRARMCGGPARQAASAQALRPRTRAGGRAPAARPASQRCVISVARGRGRCQVDACDRAAAEQEPGALLYAAPRHLRPCLPAPLAAVCGICVFLTARNYVTMRALPRVTRYVARVRRVHVGAQIGSRATRMRRAQLPLRSGCGRERRCSLWPRRRWPQLPQPPCCWASRGPRPRTCCGAAPPGAGCVGGVGARARYDPPGAVVVPALCTACAASGAGAPAGTAPVVTRPRAAARCLPAAAWGAQNALAILLSDPFAGPGSRRPPTPQSSPRRRRWWRCGVQALAKRV